jgi:RNA polymerase sigma factor (sigma-70 family)
MMLPAPEQRPDNGLEVAMDECLATLTEREKRVIEARFYEAQTLDDVANEFQLGKESVRQIEAKALRKLRHQTQIRTLGRFAGAFSA